MVKVIKDCAEGTIFIDGDGTVRKIYKKRAKILDEMYNRKGEVYILTNYTSPYFIEFIEEIPNGIRVRYGGKRLGGHDMFDPKIIHKVNKEEFIGWLRGLKQELKDLGLRHRDINPRNLLYNPQTNEFRLIDFTYTTDEDNDLFDNREKTHQHNIVYGRDDAKAIDLLIEHVNAL